MTQEMRLRYIDDESENAKMLKVIKQNVQNSYEYLRHNYMTYASSRDFIFVNAVTEAERSFNAEMMRPGLKFNILETMVNKACGEFSKASPSIKASSAEIPETMNAQEEHEQGQMIDLLAGHCRYIEYKAKKEGVMYNSFRECISGGQSSLKILSRYVNERSFEQELYLANTFDQTMIGYDPLAQLVDKSDGDYIYELFPKRLSDFMLEYEDVDVSDLDFYGAESMNGNGQNIESKSFGPFQWAYVAGDDRIVIMVDYYCKKKEKTYLLELSPDRNNPQGHKMTLDEYKKYLKDWEMSGVMELPSIEIRRRETTITKIMRYKCIQSKIISEEELHYPRFPIKYFPGNNVINRDHNASGAAREVIKPYLMHAEGTQMLMNYCGSTIANEFENMRPATIVASVEAVPEKYIEAYRKPQNSPVLLFNQFKDGNANFPLQAPILANRQQVPPELISTFMMCPEIVQNITGNFDSSLTKMANQNVSGVALDTSLNMSNTALQPYIHNWLLSYESCLQDIVDMLPTYMPGEQMLMTLSAQGDEKPMKINAKDGSGLQLKYKPGEFKIKVEAGLSFGIQQKQAQGQIVQLAQAIPRFGEFINKRCLDLVVGTLEIPHAEEYRARAKEEMAMQQQAEQAAMKAAQNQPNIEVAALQIADKQVTTEHEAAMAKVQVQAMDAKAKTVLKAAELEMDKQKMAVENQRIKADLEIALAELSMEKEKHADERIMRMIEATIKQSDHIHDKADKHYDRTLETLKADREHERAEREFERAEKEVKKDIE
jgi:hypothetical protein